MRTWVIAGIALAASTGTTLAQDAAAGEQVFAALLPATTSGKRQNQARPPLNGVDGRQAGTFEGFNYSPPTSSGITWNDETFRNTSVL